MELEHRFDLPVGIDTAWATLMDIEKVGPCFPGANLDSVQGDSFSGSVKLKMGPVRLTYTGQARVVERDDRAHTASIEATGDESAATKAAMYFTATASELSATRTQVDLVTTLSLTGRPAEFGRPMMVEVGNRLVSQFADCVSTKLVGRGTVGAKLIDVENPDEIAAERERALAAEATAVRRIPGGATDSAYHRPSDRADALLTKVLPAVLVALAAVLLRKLIKK
jgi:carbon monoxide dehydrogenase subunit G